MKLRQNEAEYQEIKKVLASDNISSAEQVDEKIQGMLKAARFYSLVSGFFMLTLLLVLPDFAIFTVMVFCLFMAWLWSSTLASKHYFKRYLDEINPSNSNSDN